MSNLLLDSFDGVGSVLELVKSGLESSQVVDLSLDPVVKVSEWVAQVLDSVAERLNKIALLHVVDNELASIRLHIVSQILILISSKGCGRASVALDQHLLVGQIAGDVVLHLLQERGGFLNEDLEFEKLGVKNVFVLLVERFDVNHGGFLEALEQLGRGHLNETGK